MPSIYVLIIEHLRQAIKKRRQKSVGAYCRLLHYVLHLSLEVALTSPPSQPHSAVLYTVKEEGVTRR